MEAAMMSWNEIKNRYPNRWVALTNYTKKGSHVLEAIPVKICEEKDMYDAEIELNKRGIPFTWRRTTELEGANILCKL